MSPLTGLGAHKAVRFPRLARRGPNDGTRSAGFRAAQSVIPLPSPPKGPGSRYPSIFEGYASPHRERPVTTLPACGKAPAPPDRVAVNLVVPVVGSDVIRLRRHGLLYLNSLLCGFFHRGVDFAPHARQQRGAHIALAGAVGLIALLLDVATSTSFINFGAFLAFTAVNLCVVRLYLAGRRGGERIGVWSGLVFPLIGTAADLWLLVSLDRAALLLGAIWFAVGLGYLCWITRFFRKPPPSVPV